VLHMEGVSAGGSGCALERMISVLPLATISQYNCRSQCVPKCNLGTRRPATLRPPRDETPFRHACGAKLSQIVSLSNGVSPGGVSCPCGAGRACHTSCVQPADTRSTRNGVSAKSACPNGVWARGKGCAMRGHWCHLSKRCGNLSASWKPGVRRSYGGLQARVS
jgi:hypothetical protein